MRNIIEYENLIWVDIIQPSEDDIKYLKNRFHLHSVALRNLIPSVYHPDVDVFKNYLFLILHYPDICQEDEIKMYELDFVVGKDFFITSHYETLSPVSRVFDECLNSEIKRKENMEKGTASLLFNILNRMLKENLSKISPIEIEIDSIEKEIYSEEGKKLVENISEVKRKVISFWRIIRPQKIVFDYLKNFGEDILGQESKHYFAILSRIQRKTENTLNVSKETIKSLEETNNILVTLKTNEIIKILTLFSVVLLPLTLVASIWGMNMTFLPLSQNRVDFWIIMLIMALISGGMIIYFKFKKWL